MKPSIRHRTLYPKRTPELAKLADCIGQFIEYWGFKAVQGRLWLYLFVSEEPLSSIELSDLLEISPALVTQSVQVLLKYRVILPAPKGPNGVLRYAPNPNVAEAIRTVLLSRETQLLEQTLDQLKRAKTEQRVRSYPGLTLSSQKMEQISGWIELFQTVLALGLDSLEGTETPFSEPALFLEKASQLEMRSKH